MEKEKNRLQYPLYKRIFKGIGQTILFLILFAILFVLGIYLGYTLLGGGHFWEALNHETWQHIIDFVTK